MQKLTRALARCLALCAAALPAAAYAHGIIGNRFFPPTIATDDPFAVDELTLPTFSYIEDSSSTKTYDTGFEFDKEIFPHFAIGVSDDYIVQKPRGQNSITGWDNLGLSAKYELWQNAPHEAIVSVGL
ncbi:MAG TPA: hypothetical protein VG722_12970, partial [Tepidisphaeraceae bacterium]|nr:hypothetical protein [Tepidisphaeraceae bacterium]